MLAAANVNAGETNPSDAEALPPGLEQIVVTAQKRAEPLQEVPMAITAYRVYFATNGAASATPIAPWALRSTQEPIKI